MEQHLDRNYLKEEEFLEFYGGCASAAAQLLDGAWRPDSSCDDEVRQQRKYFSTSGELKWLVFESAAVYHSPEGRFSSVQIVLKSATKVVTIRVTPKTDGQFRAEKIVDKTF